MNDDRTEQALRRALDDASRQVDVPMARLPEPSPVPDDRSPRRPTAVIACLVAIVALATASLVVLAARDDGTSSVQIGSTPEAGPLTADNADLTVTFDTAASDGQINNVRALLIDSDQVAFYTFVGREDALAELRLLHACSGVGASVSAEEMQPDLRVRLIDLAQYTTLAEEIVVMPGVESVAGRVGAERLQAPSTTEAPSSTTVTPTTAPAPTTLPVTTPSVSTISRSSDGTTSEVLVGIPTTTTATSSPPATEPPSSTVPTPDASSKELPFALPAPAQCPPAQSEGPACQPTAPAATLPPAGEPPSDPSSAEQAIRDMWIYTHDGSIALDERFRDHLQDADVLLPLMKSIGQDGAVSTTQILGIQFLSPTRAAVLSRNVFKGGSLDVPQVQFVVLVDGQWKWTRESQCAAIARAGVHCPEGP